MFSVMLDACVLVPSTLRDVVPAAAPPAVLPGPYLPQCSPGPAQALPARPRRGPYQASSMWLVCPVLVRGVVSCP